MNKIIVDEEVINLDNEEVILNINNDLVLNINNNVKCLINSFKGKKLTINTLKNSHSLIEIIYDFDNIEQVFNLNSYFNSTIKLNISSSYKNNNKLTINSNVLESNINCQIKVRLVEINGNMELLAVGDIKPNLEEISYLEDIKALVNKSNHIKIMPDLLVSSNQVEANHNTTISTITIEDLFYLESRGISRTIASELLKKGFKKGILEINMGGDNIE